LCDKNVNILIVIKDKYVVGKNETANVLNILIEVHKYQNFNSPFPCLMISCSPVEQSITVDGSIPPIPPSITISTKSCKQYALTIN
jgi:hypothetical protein